MSRRLRNNMLLASAAFILVSCADAPAGESAETSEVACDRACLVEATDAYVAALGANDPASAPFAEDVRFVENLQPLQPGEGLWTTATGGATDFAIHVPDEQRQEAGWLGVIENEGEPLMLALRLKFEDGEIVEAEHISVAPSEGSEERIAAPRPGLLADVPADSRTPHDRLVAIAASYYDALTEGDGSLTPFAQDCQRYENGFVAAGEGANTMVLEEGRPPVATGCAAQLDSGAMEYIARIDNRRVFAADPVTGLAMGFSHFRHPFDNLPYPVELSDGTMSERNAENFDYDPFDMPAAHVFKVGADGQVHEIEAIGFVAPFESPTGWE